MKNRKLRPGYMGSRPDVESLLTSNIKTVLDVGCSIGTLGASIKENFNASVTGIEIDEEMADVARSKIDHVIISGATEAFSNKMLCDQKFDTIIFADVLEHLVDPWRTISLSTNHLNEDGFIIASIPNIRFFHTLFHLIVKGKWPYRDRGTHDRTHLRFFTISNIQDLFLQADLNITDIKVNYRIIETPSRLNKLAKFIALPIINNFLAYQYIVKARLIKNK